VRKLFATLAFVLSVALLASVGVAQPVEDPPTAPPTKQYVMEEDHPAGRYIRPKYPFMSGPDEPPEDNPYVITEPLFHEKVDVHIHIPEGATPKDGPSAGITIAVALISALTDTPTRADVAMTGEITLRGRVLGVGGVKEKAVAAHQGGIRLVIVPASNAGDLEVLPEEVRKGVEFALARTMDEVMEAALASAPPSRPDTPAKDLMEGAADPGVQLSQ